MAIQMKNVHKSFEDNVIFEDLNLLINHNDKLALMGPSGRGKTTLLSLICGTLEPCQGAITGQGNQKISKVFQEDRLLPYKSGLSNILFPIKWPKSRIQTAIDLLTEVGLGQDIHKKAALYSGGMKRRLALCRALLTDFDLMILDEPFKGLDTALKPQIMKLVKDHIEDKTLIIVTHDIVEAEFFEASVVNL